MHQHEKNEKPTANRFIIRLVVNNADINCCSVVASNTIRNDGSIPLCINGTNPLSPVKNGWLNSV